MLLQEEQAQGQFHIQAYSPGRLRINHHDYTQSVLLSAGELVSPWQINTLSELNNSHMQALSKHQPRIVLLGSGEHLCFPDNACLAWLQAQHIGVEVMDTAAACRTYHILANEDRRVTALLLP